MQQITNNINLFLLNNCSFSYNKLHAVFKVYLSKDYRLVHVGTDKEDIVPINYNLVTET